MLKNLDIIVVGLQSLDSEIGSNCVNIANEFAKSNRVLYINYALDRITRWKARKNPLIRKRINIIKNKEDRLYKINENLYNLYPGTVLESINQIKSSGIFDYLNKVNSKRFVKQIKWAIDKLGFKDVIIFNDSDFYRSFYLKEQLNPRAYIYYTRDNMVATSYFRKHGYRYESRLMGKCDAVVANSVYLQNQAQKNNTNAYYVGQGVDLSLFNPDINYETPHDLKAIKKPVLGYIGALKSNRLDIDLIIDIAKSNPDITVVLVGPEDDEFKKSDLHKIENVVFTGSKPINSLPAYLNAFDIAFNPQAVNELTIGNYPRKIDEYLSLGKPVIATYTEAMQVFKDYVYLAKNLEEYNNAIAKALKDNNEEKYLERIKFANSHTWENSVEKIYDVIETILT